MSPDHAAKLDAAWRLRGLFTHLVAHALARPDDDWLPSLSAYETRATLIRTWDLAFVPGLWQTPEYARTIFALAHDAGLQVDAERALQARLERQAAVWERADAPRVSAVLSWVVLRSAPGGDADVMRGQLAHLLALSERPGVSVRVMGEHTGLNVGHNGAFQLLTVGGGDVAFTDAPGVGHLTLDPDRVSRYVRRFEKVNDLAWSADESRTTIEEAMARYR
ncbi:DUF5753 domain-containing protein [Actinomadura fulvescens]